MRLPFQLALADTSRRVARPGSRAPSSAIRIATPGCRPDPSHPRIIVECTAIVTALLEVAPGASDAARGRRRALLAPGRVAPGGRLALDRAISAHARLRRNRRRAAAPRGACGGPLRSSSLEAGGQGPRAMDSTPAARRGRKRRRGMAKRLDACANRPSSSDARVELGVGRHACAAPVLRWAGLLASGAAE
jgi:hypothetical protein